MRQVARGEIAAPLFARDYLAARRGSLNAGERVGDGLDRVLTDVFYLLDDFVIDAALREPTDMSDDALVAKVSDQLRMLDALDRH